MPFTRAQGDAATLKYVVLTVMNQPEDRLMLVKSLAEAMIENIEELLGISDRVPSSQPLVRIPFFPSDLAIEEFYEPLLPTTTSGIVLPKNLIPSVIAGMTSQEKSLRRIALVHSSMEPFTVTPRSITLALLLPHLHMRVTPSQI
jgi:hypothetical protein